MRFFLPLAALALLAAVARADDDIDSDVDRDPAVPAARLVNTLPPRLPGLWIEALGRPEADLKAQAAQAIALAHERGYAGMGAAAGALARELDRPDPHPTARAAVARALVVLDAKDAAAALARAAEADPDLRELVDPALARWDFKPARAEWLNRLAPPATRRGTVLAVRALGAVREPAAAPRLRELALDRGGAPAVRLEAARALAEVRQAGGEADARGLAADTPTRTLTDRLAAAALLRRHAGDEAVKLLQALARDPEPAVAAVALARLVELDPGHVLPLLDAVLASPDAAVRGFGVEALLRRPDAARVRLLGDRLSDPHPAVRRRARAALRDLAARPEWTGPVIGEATRALDGGDWRGLEQAALLLGGLGHEPAAPRLVALLEHGRGEVAVAAAWGLRRLAVPGTLPAALTYFGRRYDALRTAGAADAAAADAQLAQLAEFFGQSRHRPADAALRRLAAKAGPANPAGPAARVAAAWALGLVHEADPPADVVTLLVGRLTAVHPGDVEIGAVRRAAAVSLGRMRAAAALGPLRQFDTDKKPALDPVGNACGWAVARITGEPQPPAGTVEVVSRDWFLAPLD